MILKYVVENEKVVKKILYDRLNLSKRLVTRLKNGNRILKNGNKVFVNEAVVKSDVVEVDIDFEEECENIVPTKMDLVIIYEDEAYIILNKPAKIETHPTCANYTNTLANGLMYYFKQNGIKKKIRPVNRLDKETSGLIVFAKNEYVQEQLVKQMKDNVMNKEYIAIVEGIVEKNEGEINAPIKRKSDSILERCVSEDGDNAITEYEVINRLNKMTVVKCKLKTGRTHQIRVHMAYIGHSIVSDFLYGTRSEFIDRQALHSYKLEFVHPLNGKNVVYEIPLPKDMRVLYNWF